MKFLWLFASVGLLFSLSSCKDDNNGFPWDPQLMHYDGINNNAPLTPPGVAEFAARFGQDAMNFYSGKKIDAVQLFIYDEPEKCYLVLYGKGSNNQPGEVIYQKDIGGTLNADSWNVIELDSAIAFPVDELWISVKLEDATNMQVMGCDAGPREEGGDWLYQSTDGRWLRFNERTTDNINWNIRAMVVD